MARVEETGLGEASGSGRGRRGKVSIGATVWLDRRRDPLTCVVERCPRGEPNPGGPTCPSRQAPRRRQHAERRSQCEAEEVAALNSLVSFAKGEIRSAALHKAPAVHEAALVRLRESDASWGSPPCDLSGLGALRELQAIRRYKGDLVSVVAMDVDCSAWWALAHLERWRRFSPEGVARSIGSSATTACHLTRRWRSWRRTAFPMRRILTRR